MKWIVFFLILKSAVWACSGDCMSCHPALLKTIDTDSRHTMMKTCIKCHSANPEKMAECGSDCFACHPAAKLEASNVPEHRVIQECRDCHMKLKTTLRPEVPRTQSVVPTLRDFLKP